MWIGKCNMDIFCHKENIVASIESEKWRYILKGHSVVLEEEKKKNSNSFFLKIYEVIIQTQKFVFCP